MEIVGYERCAEEENRVHEQRHTHIKREYGVVVARCGLLEIDESLCEPRTLQIACYSRKDGEYGHNSIITLSQLTRKDDSDYEVENLGSAAVERPPEQAFRRFLF